MAATVALVFACVMTMLGIFAVWTASSWLAFPRFVIAAVTLFYLPGSQVVRLCRLQLSPLEHATLSTVLGMIATSSVYAILAWLKLPFLLWFWILAVLLGAGYNARYVLRGTWQRTLGAQPAHLFLLVALITSWIPLFFLVFLFKNLSWTANGGFTIAAGIAEDILLHTSVAAELTHTFPPQIPFIAGQKLSYHVGMDLVAAVLNRYGGLAIPDLVVRFCPTLFISIAMLSVFCFSRRLIGSAWAGMAAATLTVLGEDFSFIPGILQRSGDMWSVHFLGAPTVLSLYHVNPMVVALGLLVAMLFCLHRSIEEHRWGWLPVISLCGGALIETKIFVSLQLCLALGIVFIINLVAFGQRVFLKQGIAVLVASVPLLLSTLVANRDGGNIALVWSSGSDTYVAQASRASNWPFMVTYPFLGLVTYLGLAYGFRLLGLGELFKAFRLSRERPFHLLLAVFVVLGPILTLTMKVAPRDSPDSYNNAIWFLVASKYVATLFAVMALTRVWFKCGWGSRTLLVLAVAAASFASTIQYLVKMDRNTNELSPSVMEVIGFLNDTTRGGQVVMSRLSEPVLISTKLRLPFYDLLARFLVSEETIATRSQEVERFWTSWKRGAVWEEFLGKHNVDWIIAIRPETPTTLSQQPLMTIEKWRLKQVFANDGFLVYQVLSRLE